MVENIFRHLAQKPADRFAHARHARQAEATAGLTGKCADHRTSAVEVNRAIFFSAAIIIAGFVPLFTLSGVEGHIFGPMAKTYAYAIAGGLLATFTVAPGAERPAAARAGRGEGDRGGALAAPHLRAGWPDFACANRVVTLGCGALVVALAVLAGKASGLEFLPQSRGGQPLDPRHDARLHLAGGGRGLRRHGCGASSAGYPGSRDGDLAARPARRRHRHDRLLQRRVQRAAEAVRRLAARASTRRS